MERAVTSVEPDLGEVIVNGRFDNSKMVHVQERSHDTTGMHHGRWWRSEVALSNTPSDVRL